MAARKLLNGLTIKQDKFCREYVANDGNATAAYKAAYDVQTMSDNAIGVESCRLLADPRLALRVEELHERASIVADQTMDKLISELQEAVKLGKESNNAAAMSNAIMAKAKLLGMVVDRSEAKVRKETVAEKPKLSELLSGLQPGDVVEVVDDSPAQTGEDTASTTLTH